MVDDRAQRDKPLVTLSVFLFGKPAWEIDRLEGSPVDLELLSAIASCGQQLSRRLARAAELGKRLIERGWEGYGLCSTTSSSTRRSMRDAEELKALGIEPGEVSIREETNDSGDSPTASERQRRRL